MKEQIENAIKWLKEQPVKGCITGSCLLGYFEGQDVDIFLYDEQSFTKLFYAMWFNPMFTVGSAEEQKKCEWFMDRPRYDSKKTGGVHTIKFLYNTCVEVNIIYKKKGRDVFSVISSFDLSIIAKSYDLQTKQTLDLTRGVEEKIAYHNAWNTDYYDPDIWTASRLLRQVRRCMHYYKRGYNTDPAMHKYISIINDIQSEVNTFKSDKFEEILNNVKNNTRVIKQVCEVWLETHEITEEQIEILDLKIKQI